MYFFFLEKKKTLLISIGTRAWKKRLQNGNHAELTCEYVERNECEMRKEQNWNRNYRLERQNHRRLSKLKL